MANGNQITFGQATSNTAYSLTIQNQPINPSQTCVVSNGSGTAGITDVTNIAVTCTTNPPRFAYVANRGSNNVSAYTVDPNSGALTEVSGSPFATGLSATSVAIDPSSSFVYGANGGSGSISAYVITAASGALTALTGSPRSLRSRLASN
ncbi:MAG: beta-propeller fold lactonase family protein [Steroidobacteraceae bacterium]